MAKGEKFRKLAARVGPMPPDTLAAPTAPTAFDYAAAWESVPVRVFIHCMRLWSALDESQRQMFAQWLDEQRGK